ncbi:MAG: hypothetical protein RR297_10335, partial [Clostridia bacterium]
HIGNRSCSCALRYANSPLTIKTIPDTCKNMGIINVWTEKRKDDEVFKVYRRAYKKYFGWIKAGKNRAGCFFRIE